jgi:hypothetical protein
VGASATASADDVTVKSDDILVAKIKLIARQEGARQGDAGRDARRLASRNEVEHDDRSTAYRQKGEVIEHHRRTDTLLLEDLAHHGAVAGHREHMASAPAEAPYRNQGGLAVVGRTAKVTEGRQTPKFCTARRVDGEQTAPP